MCAFSVWASFLVELSNSYRSYPAVQLSQREAKTFFKILLTFPFDWTSFFQPLKREKNHLHRVGFFLLVSIGFSFLFDCQKN